MSNSRQNEILANSFYKNDGGSRSEKQTQLNKAFCKFCITELTIFQIGFDEAIQLCTNINVSSLVFILIFSLINRNAIENKI